MEINNLLRLQYDKISKIKKESKLQLQQLVGLLIGYHFSTF